MLVGGPRPGSPAERAGFRPGDVLEQLDGQAVASVDAVARLTAPLASRPVEAIVRRDGARIRLLLRNNGKS